MSIASGRRSRRRASVLVPLLAYAAEAFAQVPWPNVTRRYTDRGREFSVHFDGSSRVDEGQRLAGAWVHTGHRSFRAWVGEEAIVQLGPGTEVTEAMETHGLRAVRGLMPSIGMWLVRDLREGVSGAEVSERLSGAGRGLLQAVPDLYLERTAQRINVPPNDPRYSGQWFLGRIGVERAWRRVIGDRATTIVVVDNGCQTDHPDLAANMLPGRDVVSGDDDPSPSAGAGNHGTACAGLIAAATDNGLGIAGVCPECTLRCVRLLQGNGRPTPVSSDVAAMSFARDVGAAVVSNSWGFVSAIPVPGPLAAAMEELFERGRGGRGALVVFAAGNDNREIGSDELFGVRGVVTVGALNNFDEAAQFSNFGAPVDLSAPTGTLSTDLTGPAGDSPGDYTSTFGGTSSACPIVAGVAGLLFSARPEASAHEVHDALLRSARPAPFAQPDTSGHDPAYGYGVVDPEGALRRLLGEPEATDSGARDLTDASAEVGTDASAEVGADVAATRDAPGAPSPTEACGCRSGGLRGSRSVVTVVALLGLLALRSGRRRHDRSHA